MSFTFHVLVIVNNIKYNQNDGCNQEQHLEKLDHELKIFVNLKLRDLMLFVLLEKLFVNLSNHKAKHHQENGHRSES
jgi:hypothetical protein